MNIEQFYQSLGNKEVFIKIALLAGFVQSLKYSEFLENPLSSIFFAIITAVIYSLIASMITWITPEFLQPVISIILILSIFFYII